MISKPKTDFLYIECLNIKTQRNVDDPSVVNGYVVHNLEKAVPQIINKTYISNIYPYTPNPNDIIYIDNIRTDNNHLYYINMNMGIYFICYFDENNLPDILKKIS